MEGLLFPILIFAAIATVGVGLIYVLGTQDNVLAARLEAIGGGEMGGMAAGGKENAGGAESEKKGEGFFPGLIRRIGNSVRQYFEGGGGDETEHRLAMAGYNPQTKLATFHGIRMIVGLGLATAGSLFMLMTGAPLGKMVLAAGLGILGGLLLPTFWLGLQIRKRREKISAALPNMVDLLVVCVEAGLGLDAAMSRVGAELDLSAPELSRELNQLGRELSAGQTHEHALSRLAWRIGIDDVDNLVSMLIQAERFGTSIAVSLRVFSDSYRTARRQRIEEAAAKTTVKLLFPLIFFIFPAIFVILLGPAAISILVKGMF
jgi:tight adherence protein C